jgi:hypothetical protein
VVERLLLKSPREVKAAEGLLSEHAKRRLEERTGEAMEGRSKERWTEDFKEGVAAFKQRRKAGWPSLHARVQGGHGLKEPEGESRTAGRQYGINCFS